MYSLVGANLPLLILKPYKWFLRLGGSDVVIINCKKTISKTKTFLQINCRPQLNPLSVFFNIGFQQIKIKMIRIFHVIEAFS